MKNSNNKTNCALVMYKTSKINDKKKKKISYVSPSITRVYKKYKRKRCKECPNVPLPISYIHIVLV